jgi:arginyl-tRNA synthetase
MKELGARGFSHDASGGSLALLDNAHEIVEDASLRNARITLVLAVQQVIRNGLGILGVSAPESM